LDHSRATPITAGQRDYTKSVDASLFLTDRIRQWSCVLAFHQKVAPAISFDLDGTLTDRRSVSQNPFLPDEDVPVEGIVAKNHVRSFALAPTLHFDLGGWTTSLGGTIGASRTFL